MADRFFAVSVLGVRHTFRGTAPGTVSGHAAFTCQTSDIVAARGALIAEFLRMRPEFADAQFDVVFLEIAPVTIREVLALHPSPANTLGPAGAESPE